MEVVEFAIAGASAAMGIRSLWHWVRTPVALVRARHHVWFAVFVTARVGAWFTVAALFVIFAVRSSSDSAAVDDVQSFLPLAVVPFALAVLALAAAALLAVGDDVES